MKSRRGHYRKKGKLKLKKNTVYTLFAVGLFLATGLVFLSFMGNGPSSDRINEVLSTKFGGLSILFPFVLFFFAFLMLRLKKFFVPGKCSLWVFGLFCLLTRSDTGRYGWRGNVQNF